MKIQLYPLASCPLDKELSSGQPYSVDNFIQYFEQPETYNNKTWRRKDRSQASRIYLILIGTDFIYSLEFL
jgi:hypothetical protein